MYIKLLFLPTAALVLPQLMIDAARHRRRRLTGYLCTFKNTYSCEHLQRSIWEKLDIPPNSCYLHDCSSCAIINRTYVLLDNFHLVSPTNFIVRDTDIVDLYSTTYTCSSSNNDPCDCDAYNCNGPADFCNFSRCSNNGTCSCALTHNQLQLSTIHEGTTLVNPKMVIFELCYFDQKTSAISRAHSRKLLEGESAIFQADNVTVKFEDPILYLPARGKVIVRSSDFEHILTVPADLTVKIPFEFLAYKTDITVIYLHTNGHVIKGQFHVSGKTVCQIRQCFFCTDVFRHFRCYPAAIQYLFYGLLLILATLALLCVKLLLKSVWFFIYSALGLFYCIFRTLKFCARCSLLLGAFIGNTFREIMNNMYGMLERHAAQRAQVHALPLILLLCLLNVALVQSDCNTQSIVKSDLKACVSLPDGAKDCHIYTTAEITLPAIAAEHCLWLTDDLCSQLM